MRASREHWLTELYYDDVLWNCIMELYYEIIIRTYIKDIYIEREREREICTHDNIMLWNHITQFVYGIILRH